MEKDKFDITETIEQKPFEKYSFAKFFEDWCIKNGGIPPKVISRATWEKLSTEGVAQKNEEGKQELLIPQDLQLWEMVGITEKIQHHTFPNDHEKRSNPTEEMQKLGKTFRNAGIYIAQRSHTITEGKDIARALSEELYKYGDALLTGKQTTEANPWEKIAEEEFDPESIAETDRFLAGDTLFFSRQERVKDGANEEEVRQQTLAQFFRTAKKAFHLEKISEKNELSLPKEQTEPWKKDAPIHSAFLLKVEDSLKKEIEKPKTELVGSVFQQGMELLRTNMPLPGSSNFDSIDRLITFWEKSGASLEESLGTRRMRSELEKVKQTGDIAAISKKEKEIADKIQQAISSYAYEEGESNPSSAIETRRIDCVIGSMLSGSFLSQAGINYLVGDVPEHSMLVIPFADGTAEWRDMIGPVRNAKITDEMIEGNLRDKKSFVPSDFAELINDPSFESATLHIKGSEYREKFSWISENQGQYLKVFLPLIGHKIQLLNNTGMYFTQKGEREKDTNEKSVLLRMASEAFKQSISIDPKNVNSYVDLGNTLLYLGRYEDAKKSYQQAVSFADPVKDQELVEKVGKILRELEESATDKFLLRQKFSATPSRLF